VVSPKDGYAVAVSQLHCHQEGDSLYGVITPVYIISHKKIVGIRGVSTDAKKL
jgi:hypothetical protein